MPTFARVNSVLVDPTQTKVRDLYLDAGWTAGTYAANEAQPLQTTASSSVCYRGMPIAVSKSTGGLVPISVASNASNAAGVGVLTEDIDPHKVATGRKVAYATSGRVRSYAAGALGIGDPVKYDTTAAFAGFAKWVQGTDDPSLLVGHAYPTVEGAASNAAGDTIFVDLIG